MPYASHSAFCSNPWARWLKQVSHKRADLPFTAPCCDTRFEHILHKRKWRTEKCKDWERKTDSARGPDKTSICLGGMSRNMKLGLVAHQQTAFLQNLEALTGVHHVTVACPGSSLLLCTGPTYVPDLCRAAAAAAGAARGSEDSSMCGLHTREQHCPTLIACRPPSPGASSPDQA